MTFPLRDYQQTLVDQVRQAIREHWRKILVVAATGAGKTVVFSYITRGAVAKGRRILILAHRDQLIKQASKKLRDNGVDHGIIMAGMTPNPMARAQVGSVQTVVRRLPKMRFKPDIIVIDEAHLSAAKSYRTILEAFPGAVVLGFTGSPCRLDNKPLGAVAGGIYDYMVEAVSIRQLIDRGFLVQPRVFASREQLDLSGVKKTAGDYNQKELAKVVDKPKLVGDAVGHYQRICPGVPAVAWCVNIDHAQHVADAFNASGIPAVMLCGNDSSERRDEVMDALATGKVKVVTFVGILIEGVDCPAIEAIIMLRPTMSLSSYLQVIGRGLRPHANKSCCYVLDHAGLTFRHGLADDEREWSLEEGEVQKGKKKKKNEPKVDMWMCDGPRGCFAVFHPQPTCPNCGEQIIRKTRSLDVAEGELTEITPEMAAKMRREKRREVSQAKTLDDLRKIGAERGYRPGWADAVYEARQRRSAG